METRPVAQSLLALRCVWRGAHPDVRTALLLTGAGGRHGGLSAHPRDALPINLASSLGRSSSDLAHVLDRPRHGTALPCLIEQPASGGWRAGVVQHVAVHSLPGKFAACAVAMVSSTVPLGVPHARRAWRMGCKRGGQRSDMRSLSNDFHGVQAAGNRNLGFLLLLLWPCDCRSCRPGGWLYATCSTSPRSNNAVCLSSADSFTLFSTL